MYYIQQIKVKSFYAMQFTFNLTHLPFGVQKNISLQTAVRWIHQLGFSLLSFKKGTYFDGHERDDVKEYRKLYLRKL